MSIFNPYRTVGKGEMSIIYEGEGDTILGLEGLSGDVARETGVATRTHLMRARVDAYRDPDSFIKKYNDTLKTQIASLEQTYLDKLNNMLMQGRDYNSSLAEIKKRMGVQVKEIEKTVGEQYGIKNISTAIKRIGRKAEAVAGGPI